MTRSRTLIRARSMRRALTPPEARLWTRLRRNQLDVTFRRQHPIDPYVLDFYCASAKLCVEVDGETHATDEQAAKDAGRTAVLSEQGIRVMRFPAEDIRVNLDGVLDAIRAAVSKPGR